MHYAIEFHDAVGAPADFVRKSETNYYMKGMSLSLPFVERSNFLCLMVGMRGRTLDVT